MTTLCGGSTSGVFDNVGGICDRIRRGSSRTIAKDSPSYATSLVAKVEKAGNSLVQFPERGRVVSDYDEESLRELFVGRYRLIYRVRARTVAIVAFVHSARDLASLFPPIDDGK